MSAESDKKKDKSFFQDWCFWPTKDQIDMEIRMMKKDKIKKLKNAEEYVEKATSGGGVKATWFPYKHQAVPLSALFAFYFQKKEDDALPSSCEYLLNMTAADPGLYLICINGRIIYVVKTVTLETEGSYSYNAKMPIRGLTELGTGKSLASILATAPSGHIDGVAVALCRSRIEHPVTRAWEYLSKENGKWDDAVDFVVKDIQRNNLRHVPTSHLNKLLDKIAKGSTWYTSRISFPVKEETQNTK